MEHPLFESLKVYHADSFGWALACCAWRQELAEDVLQESYLRVLDGRATFSAKSSPRTWFFAVIKRVAADAQRTQKRHRILNFRLFSGDDELAAVPVDDLTDPSAAAFQRSEASRQLQHALMQISQRQREVLHLAFYAELTLEQVAEALDISVGSARTHYHRGKERVAQILTLDKSHD